MLFAIRVRVHPLAQACAGPAEAARLAGAVRALPEEMQRYKDMLPFRAALLDWLDAPGRRLTSAPPGSAGAHGRATNSVTLWRNIFR